MELKSEQLQKNWNELLLRIETYISEPRKSQLRELHLKYEDRLILAPASGKKEFHGCWPGGLIYHTLGVIDNSIILYDVWKQQGANMNTFTKEELVFSAIMHDAGKWGNEVEESYLPNTNQWRKDKLGETYMFNSALPFSSVPDRSLFILQDNGIKYSFNEMLAIQIHDGLYDEANKKYLIGFLPEQKPRTCLPYILHQADIMASRIEFEIEHEELLNPPINKIQPGKKETFRIENKKTPIKQQVLSSVTSGKKNNLINLINSL